MLSLKLIGVILVLLAGILGAAFWIGQERKKLATLDAWIALLAYIRNQIDCYLTPLPAILLHKEAPKIPLCQSAGGSLQTRLAGSAAYLGEEELRLLSSFVREIGNHYREEQIKQCNYYLERLKLLRDKRAAELPARLRVGLALSLCASLGLSILLW